ncbi:radical SAM protein [Desulfurococcus mucosus]|uniref:Radical SAM domain protein n=1 Tax=Desulfurococcus mucosus (strain ATCC 35584 / DSM 2162 / JCM 9187 / O7/1) TaxID=765177 RepID=E8RA39_DESM0|nr:radical SAM protein [Desulfurococcus mucosus]ADV65365.1 Radical SAM domain protein [Desulfurococcus mucosus DSM 2162]
MLDWFKTLLTYRPDALTVWSDPVVAERLSWYHSVMRDEKPARFMVARRIPVDSDPYAEESLEELWRMHDRASREHESLLRDVSERGLDAWRLGEPRYSYLDVKIAIAYRLIDGCILCERRCGARRTQGKPGVCLVDKECIVHSYFHHMGEEAPLVPSGTVFYGGCNFKCVYCQNWEISQVHARSGERVAPGRLAIIQRWLRLNGARNINHVGGEPTPHLPFILESLKHLDVNVPQLWNSNMYMSWESMRLLIDIVDIWLPDLKYGSNECAWRLSKVRNYWEVATRNIKAAHDSGDIIIRHLVLPGHVECCTRRVLEWIASNTPRALVNIMDQYRPEHLVARYPRLYQEIARRPSTAELKAAYEIADSLGIEYRQVS